jgi:tetratricopeptide (TPR) repeat protein
MAAARRGDASNILRKARALQRQDRAQEAGLLYAKAIALEPANFEALLGLASFCVGERKGAEAAALLARAMPHAPATAEARNALGEILAALGRHDEAVAQYEQALAIDPGNTSAHFNLSLALEFLGRVEDATLHCREAIAAAPNHANAHNNLGRLLQQQGESEAAQRAVEKAIALAPGNPASYRNLTELRKFNAGDPYLEAMAAMLPGIAARPLRDQMELHFALGKALADTGDLERSLRHLIAGNALLRRQIDYDEAATLRLFDRIRAVFTAEFIAARRGLGAPTSVPVFIVGMPRSGTTLVEQILASHGQVFGAGELGDFGAEIARLGLAPGPEYPEIVQSFAAPQFRALGARYFAAIRARARQAERIIDKLPANFRDLGLIALALPNARIIHVRRDAIDTCLSCFATIFAANLPYTYDLAELGRYYRAYASLMDHWRAVLPAGTMIDVDYEALVADCEGEARRLVAHCGLPWSAACLDFHRSKRLVRTASAGQVRQPIYRSSIGRWRASAHLLRPLLDGLGPSIVGPAIVGI